MSIAPFQDGLAERSKAVAFRKGVGSNPTAVTAFHKHTLHHHTKPDAQNKKLLLLLEVGLRMKFDDDPVKAFWNPEFISAFV